MLLYSLNYETPSPYLLSYNQTTQRQHYKNTWQQSLSGSKFNQPNIIFGLTKNGINVGTKQNTN